MEIREWAFRILGATTLEEKLLNPKNLTDLDPGSSYRFKTPSRPSDLSFTPFSKKHKLPAFHEHEKIENRIACLHRFAGHELLAVEMMAFALLAFPSAPKHFRKGLANTLKEEQWHVKIYQDRLLELGCTLSDLPFNDRFWKLTKLMDTPLSFITIMHLTLEMANLDFAPHYGSSFKRHGDTLSAKLMEKIYQDEISHVSFGYHWLNKLKSPNLSDFDAYLFHLDPSIPLKRSKGFIFQKEARELAGLSDEFIKKIQTS